MVRVLKLVNTKDKDMEVVEVYTQLTLEKVQNILERVFKVSLSLSLLNKVNRIHQFYFRHIISFILRIGCTQDNFQNGVLYILVMNYFAQRV